MTCLSCCVRDYRHASFDEFNQTLESIADRVSCGNDIIMVSEHPFVAHKPSFLQRCGRVKALARYIEANHWAHPDGTPRYDLSEKAIDGLSLMMGHADIKHDLALWARYADLLQSACGDLFDRFQTESNQRQAARLDEVMQECEDQIAACKSELLRTAHLVQWSPESISVSCKDAELDFNKQAMSVFTWEEGFWQGYSSQAARLFHSMAKGELQSACVSPALRDELLELAERLGAEDLVAALQNALHTGVQIPRLSDRLSELDLASHKKTYQNRLLNAAGSLWSNGLSVRGWQLYRENLVSRAQKEREEAKLELIRGMYDPQAPCIVQRLDRLMQLQAVATEKALAYNVKFPSGRHRWFEQREESGDISFVTADGKLRAHSLFMGTSLELDLSGFSKDVVNEFIAARYGLEHRASLHLFRLAVHIKDWQLAQAVYDRLDDRPASMTDCLDFLRECPSQVNPHRHIKKAARHIGLLATLPDRADTISVSHILRMEFEAHARGAEWQIWEVLRPYAYKHPELAEQFYKGIIWKRCSKEWVQKTFGEGGRDAQVFLPNQVKEAYEQARGDGTRIRNGGKGDFILMGNNGHASLTSIRQPDYLVTVDVNYNSQCVSGVIYDGASHHSYDVPLESSKISWITQRNHRGSAYLPPWTSYSVFTLRIGESGDDGNGTVYVDGNLTVSAGHRTLPKIHGDVRIV